MKVDIHKLDRFRLGAESPILLFRQRETAEFVLSLACEATTGGHVSADHAEILAVINTFPGTDGYLQHLREKLDQGLIVGVILE